ncbi:zinc knuckle-domain-containing protein [Aspergillus pseudotamarii]|uniref:Zinc knuckle-domain-containing protein n=1 Tax=Aspergillus pseudotamarii TaxID=132259 RepID=A0A5N6SNE5_ASPPS|nr:zinc knuckle-domain-containing protein [Aspergillus pseudotamarii]KAE8136202.1 zinc knuckle-domain-containing protein [Aspergillus pseudotamarii]
MNRYRNAPSLRGPTKATASTLCQKCLKRGHYSYECTISAQERPYQYRPSRTQQLQNPKLRPQLSAETPNDLLRSQGVADDLLTKREEERGRKRDIDESGSPDSQGQTLKRARSASSHSVSSVSTISTSRSHSQSPPRRRGYSARNEPHGTKSASSHHEKLRKRRYSDSSSSHSAHSYSYGEKDRTRSRSREWTGDRNTRRRRRASSPEERGRARNLSRDGSRRDRTRSQSIDQGRIARERRSATPETMHDPNRPGRLSRDTFRHSGRSDGGYSKAHGEGSGHNRGHAVPQPRRERSLSPYSKRLALTQAMNIGRPGK